VPDDIRPWSKEDAKLHDALYSSSSISKRKKRYLSVARLPIGLPSEETSFPNLPDRSKLHLWNFKKNEPLVVHVLTHNSRLCGGTTAELLKILKETYEEWRTVPGSGLPVLQLIEDSTDAKVPSSHHTHEHVQQDNRNEISFAETSESENRDIIGESTMWFDPATDYKTILEIDVVFDSRDPWALHPRSKGSHHQHQSSHYMRNVAVAMWGSFLGLPISTHPDHALCMTSNLDETRKMSLNSHDRTTLVYYYPSSSSSS
jgi:hypothetical protein